MGDMGLSVGIALFDSGFEVLTNLDGRSEKTVKNVKSSNIKNVTLEDLINNSDIILSIIPPNASIEVANKFSVLSKQTSKPIPTLNVMQFLQVLPNLFKNHLILLHLEIANILTAQSLELHQIIHINQIYIYLVNMQMKLNA